MSQQDAGNIQTTVIPPKRGSQQNALGTELWISDMFNELGEWIAFIIFLVSPLGSNKVLVNKQLLLNVRLWTFFPQEDWKEDRFLRVRGLATLCFIANNSFWKIKDSLMKMKWLPGVYVKVGFRHFMLNVLLLNFVSRFAIAFFPPPPFRRAKNNTKQPVVNQCPICREKMWVRQFLKYQSKMNI